MKHGEPSNCGEPLHDIEPGCSHAEASRSGSRERRPDGSRPTTADKGEGAPNGDVIATRSRQPVSHGFGGGKGIRDWGWYAQRERSGSESDQRWKRNTGLPNRTASSP